MTDHDALALADTLAAVAADLEGYIERRAFELAAPMVEMAGVLVDEHLAVTQARLQRYEDLFVECRRQLDSRDRRIKEGPTGLHAALCTAFLAGHWRAITEPMPWHEREAAAKAVEGYAKRVKLNPPVDLAELRWWSPPIGARR